MASACPFGTTSTAAEAPLARRGADMAWRHAHGLDTPREPLLCGSASGTRPCRHTVAGLLGRVQCTPPAPPSLHYLPRKSHGRAAETVSESLN